MMALACSLIGHHASEDVIANAGEQFNRCTRCNADLILIEGKWTLPPKGFAIVWRKAGPSADAIAKPRPSPALVAERRGSQRRRNNLRHGLSPCRRTGQVDRRNFGTKVWNHV
jgi:hypothetical protein